MNIVFDFGNVLFEWNPVQLIREHYVAESAMPDPHGSPESLADRLINHRDWLEFDLGLIDSRELAARSGARLGLDAAPLLKFVDRIPHVLPPIETAISSVQPLAEAGHRVFYLSNMPAAFADVLEVRCPWIARFETGIFSGRVNLAKPDPAIYAAAEQTFQLDPSDTLFLDDAPHNVAAARERGWRAEIISGPQSTQDALARHVGWAPR